MPQNMLQMVADCFSVSFIQCCNGCEKEGYHSNEYTLHSIIALNYL